MRRALKRMMTGDTIHIAPKSSEDFFQDETHGSQTEYDGRYVEGKELARSQTGEEVLSTSQVKIVGDVDVTHDHEVQVPGGDTPRIVEIRKPKGTDGEVKYTHILFE